MRKPIAMIFVCVVTSLGALLPAYSETVTLNATLSGKAERPANDSVASGTAHFSYDTSTRQLTYFVRFRGLSGPATAADVHGPADESNAAPVVVHFYAPESPISGNTTLSDGQAADLMNGRYYVEVNTSAHEHGEIRGQIHK